MEFSVKKYEYKNRIGSLHAEAVGVVKGKKYFPVFEGNQIFKPLTKSKPFSNPLFAYAEVFWSKVIREFFMEVPEYELAICDGYEREEEKYYDYGTVVPKIYGEGEHLLNLLEYFRENPDDAVDIDQYVNYCMMFYDYTDILESRYFREHKEIAEQLAMHILVSILKGDQNYHYENVAFVCDASNRIVRLAPMIDHEFSTYFMFPDAIGRNYYWLGQLKRSIAGTEVKPGEYADIPNETERALYEKSAVNLYKNIVYIKQHYSPVLEHFLEKMGGFERALEKEEERFFLKKNPEYPSQANSDAYLMGKARYKEKDEEQALMYEKKYGEKYREIHFDLMSELIIGEIKEIMAEIYRICNFP